jgi:carbamoyl-phosphate synthase large subunit
MRVLVAGIGGASLGTEILKCLQLAGTYEVFGCDISPYAFGHYQGGTIETFVVPVDGYPDAVLDLCRRNAITWVIPGGEEPLRLLSAAAERFQRAGVRIAANRPAVVTTCSDKAALFARLAQLGVPVPWTATVTDIEAFAQRTDVPTPCVVKPATGSGGSAFVYLADSLADARAHVAWLLQNGRTPLIQEYLPVDEGEFTVGVLSRPDGSLIGSIALQRLFHAKLSVQQRSEAGLISSGYSQGLIDDFPEVRAQAERIAAALESAGPMNIQGRLRNGTLYPFEINPRFSASVYLRAMAGFNEVDAFLKASSPLVGRQSPSPLWGGSGRGSFTIRPGYYLRSLDEVFVPRSAVKGDADAGVRPAA